MKDFSRYIIKPLPNVEIEVLYLLFGILRGLRYGLYD